MESAVSKGPFICFTIPKNKFIKAQNCPKFQHLIDIFVFERAV